MPLLKDEGWTPAQTIATLVGALISMMMAPDTETPLVPEICHQFLSDRAAFDKTAREWTEKYATGETE